MKKTALTIAVFSLVVVATSFASPEAPSNLAQLDSVKTIDPGVNGNYGRRKADFQLNQDNFNSFAKDSQSVNNKKID